MYFDYLQVKNLAGAKEDTWVNYLTQLYFTNVYTFVQEIPKRDQQNELTTNKKGHLFLNNDLVTINRCSNALQAVMDGSVITEVRWE
mmetsp:Transcript_17046/g.22512  ORF Transcript_17046/g.22512 Transcript_17046/m.22512 type:complete len:87 (-) Transcript_17046:1356-1616(-)